MGNEKNAKIQQEIIVQKSLLSSGESDIGDWKVIKCYEAKLKDTPMPYNVDDLLAKRAEVRKRINELEAQLEA